MRITLLSLFPFFALFTFGKTEESTFVFSGYIFSEDSVPFENVYLINYRDTKIVATNEKGFFKMNVQAGDSLMINHISLKPTVILANGESAKTNNFYIEFRRYQIKAVSTDKYKREKENLNKNMENISFSIAKDLDYRPTQNDSGGNAYNPGRVSLGIDLKGFFKLFEKKRHKNR